MHPDIERGLEAEIAPDLATRYLTLNADRKLIEAEERGSKSELLMAMGNAQYATCQGHRIADRRNGRGDNVTLYANTKSEFLEGSPHDQQRNRPAQRSRHHPRRREHGPHERHHRRDRSADSARAGDEHRLRAARRSSRTPPSSRRCTRRARRRDGRDPLRAELGLNPIQSLQQIFVVQGKPAIYARTMVALLKTRGYLIETIESTDTSVTVRGTDPQTGIVEESTWTIDRAKKAGYTSNKKYDTDPHGDAVREGATEVARKIAPDVLLGIAHSREELELDAPVLATPSA
ncbi:hypothetical protein GS436_21025 [Rhodococcus hoagii]|nr:hypothetical protein [Prescottella equi]